MLYPQPPCSCSIPSLPVLFPPHLLKPVYHVLGHCHLSLVQFLVCSQSSLKAAVCWVIFNSCWLLSNLQMCLPFACVCPPRPSNTNTIFKKQNRFSTREKMVYSLLQLPVTLTTLRCCSLHKSLSHSKFPKMLDACIPNHRHEHSLRPYVSVESCVM